MTAGIQVLSVLISQACLLSQFNAQLQAHCDRWDREGRKMYQELQKPVSPFKNVCGTYGLSCRDPRACLQTQAKPREQLHKCSEAQWRFPLGRGQSTFPTVHPGKILDFKPPPKPLQQFCKPEQSRKGPKATPWIPQLTQIFTKEQSQQAAGWLLRSFQA